MSIPTLGSLTIDSDRRVNVVVDDLGGNAQVRVEYAVVAAGSPPPSTSLVWVVADTVTASPGDVLIPPQAYTATVWIRAVGMTSAGEQATPYTTPISVDIEDVPRFSFISAILVTRVPTIRWEAGDLALGVRISWEVHNTGDDPGTLANVVDVDAEDAGYAIDVLLELGQAVTITVEAWGGWDGSLLQVEGDAGQLYETVLTTVPGDRVEVHTITDDDMSGGIYTLTITDDNVHLIVASASGASVLFPLHEDVALPVGSTLWVEQGGVGIVMFSAMSGVTIRSEGSRETLIGQYAVAMVRKVGLNAWTITGDLMS